MNSSDDDDIIEIESSTDSQIILNSENQSEADNANISLNVTNDMSECEAKESEQKTAKGQEKAFKFAELKSAKSSKSTEYTGKKKQEEQKFQNQKKSH